MKTKIFMPRDKFDKNAEAARARVKHEITDFALLAIFPEP
jgi:hypothetical protein